MGNGTSIGRVRGLGSAKAGAHHWLLQRFTAAGNLLLGFWLAISLVLLPDTGFASMTSWIAAPIPATAMALLLISTLWHARLGLQVVVEDYVHDAGNKFAAVLALNLAVFGGGAFGLFCLARLAFASAGGAA